MTGPVTLETVEPIFTPSLALLLGPPVPLRVIAPLPPVLSVPPVSEIPWQAPVVPEAVAVIEIAFPAPVVPKLNPDAKPIPPLPWP